ncbi:MAG: type I-A CRISPR-associated protein Cas5a [Sulfolobales archaeon]
MKLVIVKARIFWGYSIKQPAQTAAQDSTPLPPPTTVLGALASSYARYFKLPEIIKINDNIYSTAAKLLMDNIIKYCTSGLMEPAVKYSDISRNIMLTYQRHKQKDYHFAVQAMGKVYSPSNKGGILLAYIVNKEYDLISKISWGITTIGSKEGMVSVYDVITTDIKKVEIRKNQIIKTPFITPADIARCEKGCTEVSLCSLSPDSYLAESVCREEKYLIPVYPEIKDIYGGESMVLKVIDNVEAIETRLEGDNKTYILVPGGIVD